VPAVALCIYVMFMATAFGLRSWIQYRRTGTTVCAGFSGENRSMGICVACFLSSESC
jgi:hypothetical protein